MNKNEHFSKVFGYDYKHFRMVPKHLQMTFANFYDNFEKCYFCYISVHNSYMIVNVVTCLSGCSVGFVVYAMIFIPL